MSTQVEAWLQQAEADLRASRVVHADVGECHRRCWLQQSYEKAIKAYALMRWRGATTDEPDFARQFLLQHSPLKAVANAKTPLSKALSLLAREVDVFVAGLDNANLLGKIDATTPRNDPTEVSYRYPFQEDTSYVAPVEWGGWDGYQGNIDGARAAVKRLLDAVRREHAVFARKPK